MLKTRKKLQEDGEAPATGNASAAPVTPQGSIGGATAPFQTPFNTLGIGNPVSPHGDMPGSGDLIGEYIDKIKNKPTRVRLRKRKKKGK